MFQRISNAKLSNDVQEFCVNTRLQGKALETTIAKIKASKDKTKVTLRMCFIGLKENFSQLNNLIDALSSIPVLYELDLSHNYLDDNAVKLFASHLHQFKKLKVFNLIGNDIDHKGAEEIIKAADNLKRDFTLLLGLNKLTLEKQQKIVNYSKLLKLELIVPEEKVSILSEHKVSKSKFDPLLFKLSMHPVEVVDIKSEELGCSEIKQLCDVIEKNQLHYLKELKLACSKLKDSGANRLLQMAQKYPSLKITNLRKENLSAQVLDVKEISDFLEKGKFWQYFAIFPVTKIKIRNCDSDSLKALSNIIKPHSQYLTEIDLSQTKLNNQGAFNVADLLKSCDKLKYLNLSGNLIGDYGAKELAKALSLSSLNKFDISSNCIFADGIDALRKVCLNSSHIQEFDLGNNSVIDGCDEPEEKPDEYKLCSPQAKKDGIFSHALVVTVPSDTETDEQFFEVNLSPFK